MSFTETAVSGTVAGDVPLYSRPEPLNAEQHGGLGLVRSDAPFGFAETGHAVPVHVTEFGPAAINYPIVFAGDDRTPIAILSIRQNENLFIQNGRYEPEAYIPAFIRRYPFVVANDDANKQLLVCIDRAASMLSPDGEVRLFENGQPSEYTRACIQFCTDFETERQRTMSFVQTLKDMDLFESRVQSYTPQNPDGSPAEPVKLADYFAVTEEKLKALTPEQLVQLRDSGALQQIYAHMNSLFGWDKLVARTIARAPGDAVQAANNA